MLLFNKSIFTHSTITKRCKVITHANKLKTQITKGRFTTAIENFHGRIAMLGITGCAFGEQFAQIPIIQQFTMETGLTSLQTLALITVITSAFVLETVNPVTIKNEEIELDVLSNPGFTLETEILHGRIAMLAFAWAVLGEELYSKLFL